MASTILVSPGKSYIIAAQEGTTVTDKDGFVLATLAADSPAIFTATTNEVTISSEDFSIEQLDPAATPYADSWSGLSASGGGGYVTSDGDNIFTGNNAFTGTVTFSGTVIGLPEGPQGAPGPQGDPGESAYQIWLDAGNQGTEEDFLASLKGPKGDTGATGADGATGATGAPGPQGDPGKSAYQIWLDEGNSGTEEEFLESLKGPKGDTGEQGPPGADGAPGPQGEPGEDGSPGVIIPITGQTVVAPASVNMGDELVFSTDAAIAIDTVLSVITKQISIGWTVNNTGSATISVTNGGEEIASVDAGSSVSGKWIRTSSAVYISVFKRALGEEGNNWIVVNDAGEAVLNFPDKSTNDLELFSIGYSRYTKLTGSTAGKINCTTMCWGCAQLKEVDVEVPNGNTSNMFPNCSNLIKAKLIAPVSTQVNSLFQNDTKLQEVYLYAPKATSKDYMVTAAGNIVTFSFNLASFNTINFSSNSSSVGYLYKLENVTILEGGLASCTSFIITNSTKLTDASIQNIIDALPDYSTTGTSALVSFPPDRLTEEQQTQITNKGWTWS